MRADLSLSRLSHGASESVCLTKIFISYTRVAREVICKYIHVDVVPRQGFYGVAETNLSAAPEWTRSPNGQLLLRQASTRVPLLGGSAVCNEISWS